MEHMDLEEKSVSVTFKITPTMKKKLDALMKEKKWKFSAFLRVAIEQELAKFK